MGERRAISLSTIGGQNSGLSSDVIPEDQYWRGVNISSRGGKSSTRPPLRRIEVDGSKALFEDARFQGAGVFQIAGGDKLVMVCGGKVIGIDVNTWEVFDYQQPMNANVTRCYFGQPDKYFVVQDGESLPVICNFDNVTTHARQAFRVDNGDPIDEIPIGTVMAYGHGRLFVAIEKQGTDLFGNPQNVGSRFFQASDFMLPSNPISVLGFTEADYLNGGGSFALPNELQLIRGMAFMRNADTGSGWGEMFVFAEGGVSRFAFESPRNQWSVIDISRVAFTGAGTLSPYSIVSVNSDLMFRGTDKGIRSLLYTSSKIRENAGGLANEPMSAEVRDLLENDNRIFLQYVSGAYVDDRVLMTAYGALDGVQPYFKSLVSLDGNTFSSLSTPAQPIYDGMWTGLKFLQVLKTKSLTQELGICVALDENGKNALYKIDEGEYRDGGSSRTVTRRYTRSEVYDAPELVKRLLHCEIYLSGIVGQVDVTIYYKPHGYALWTEMGSMTVESDPTGLPRSIDRIRFGLDDENFALGEGDATYKARAFQFCIEITGKAQVEQFVSTAQLGDTTDAEVPTTSCEVSSTSVKLEEGDAGIELDDYEYEIAT